MKKENHAGEEESPFMNAGEGELRTQEGRRQEKKKLGVLKKRSVREKERLQHAKAKQAGHN